MKKIGIFFGTTTGVTEEIAHKIAASLGVADTDVMNVADVAPSSVAPFDLLMFGCSTWGDGDMQDDMHDFLDGVAALDLENKQIALFGCGDDTMADTFCNAVGEMYSALKDSQATFVGEFDADGYSFQHSKAQMENGRMRGLVIDEVNHPELTTARIARWCDTLR